MIRFLVYLVLPAAILGAALHAQHGPPPTMDGATIELAAAVRVPMRMVDGARAAVEVMINGRGPYVLGIETGGPYGVVLDSKVLADLRLDATSPSRLPVVDSMRIGGLVIRRVGVGAQPVRGIPGIDGLLGIDFYRDLLITLDYPARMVRFERDSLPVPNGRDVLAIRRGQARLVAVDATVGGRPMTLVIDTQGGGSPLFCAAGAADSLRFAAPPAVIGQARVGGIGAPPRPSYAARLDGDVRFGGITIQRPILGILALPPSLGCLLGTEFLKRFAMTLDQRTMRVRFAASTLTIPPAPSMYTLGLGALPDSAGMIRVTSVIPGGAADAAGLQTGDEIATIDGRPADWSSASPQQLRAIAERGTAIRVELRRGGRIVPATLDPLLAVR